MTALVQALLVLLLQATALLALGLLALHLTQKHGPAVQTLVGRASLTSVALLVLLLPLTGQIQPVVRVPEPTPQQRWLPEEQAAILPEPTPPPHWLPAGQAATLPPFGSASAEWEGKEVQRTKASPASTLRPPLWGGPLRGKEVGSLWAAVSALLLLWLSVCQWHLTRLRRIAEAITTGPAVALLAELTPNPPRLLTHPSVHSPFLAGYRHSAIFLPVAFETQFDADALRAIFVHELTHLSRRDSFWTLAARLLSALLWPQPLLWLLVRKLEHINEDACDEAVLAHHCPPRAYANCLLALASHSPLRRPERTLSAGVAPFRSSVGRRISRILTAKGVRPMPPITLRLRLTAAALTLTAALGGAFLVSSAPAQSGQPVRHNALSQDLHQISGQPKQQEAELDQARLLAGLTPIQGPGVVVTLTDSKKRLPTMPAGMPPPSIIHDSDIGQVVNELRAAGAEAIAVNNQRLVAISAVRTAGQTILINNAPQAVPYTIEAIGNPKTLAGALTLPGGIADQIKTFDPAMIKVQEAPTLTLPAYTSADMPRYARPVGEVNDFIHQKVMFLQKTLDTRKGTLRGQREATRMKYFEVTASISALNGQLQAIHGKAQGKSPVLAPAISHQRAIAERILNKRLMESTRREVELRSRLVILDAQIAQLNRVASSHQVH